MTRPTDEEIEERIKSLCRFLDVPLNGDDSDAELSAYCEVVTSELRWVLTGSRDFDFLSDYDTEAFLKSVATELGDEDYEDGDE